MRKVMLDIATGQTRVARDVGQAARSVRVRLDRAQANLVWRRNRLTAR
jgi:hypothetical protein